MQKKVYFLIFFAIVNMSRFALVQAQELVPDILIVNFKAEIGSVSVQLEKGIASIGIRSIDALLSKYNVVQMERLFPGLSRPEPGSNLLDLTRYYRLRFSSPFSLQDVINEFKKNTFVGHVEPTAVMPIDASANDPQLNNQWAISKIQTPQAWDIAVGNTSILLAIIDTGIDWNHPDLDGNIWVTSAEDRNGNGRPDFYAFSQGGISTQSTTTETGILTTLWGGISTAGVSGDNNPWPDFDPGEDGHGTAVAGTAGEWGNQVGVRIMG